MKIVHTSDWHVGRRWKGIQRLDEAEAVLEHLADFIERERVDIVLHTGDIFDSRNPPAEAERLVNQFFIRVGKAGARMIGIAGNHDDPLRLDARALLAEFAGVHLVGRPRRASDGGSQIVETKKGERACVGVLPFASPGAWVTALDLAGDEATAHSRYALMFQKAVHNLTAPFRSDTVNILMAHTHMDGAVFGESERQVHLGDDWAATPQALPATASYVALGHIHKPQKVGETVPAYYAGSPLQLDFGEVGQQKTFVLVTVSPGRPAQVEHIPYEGGHPLVDLRAPLADLGRCAAPYLHRCWLRVTVPLDEKDPDINRKVRDLLPHALVVRAEIADPGVVAPVVLVEGATPAQHYRAYHLQEYREEPQATLLGAFNQLYEEILGSEAGDAA